MGGGVSSDFYMIVELLKCSFKEIIPDLINLSKHSFSVRNYNLLPHFI